MHEVKRKTVRIDTDEEEDLKAYDRIQNDPCSTIVQQIQEKLSASEYNEEGKLSRKWDRLILIVTYETRKLL